MQIKIMQNILQANNEKAQELRTILQDKQIVMLNLISSPGSGKTTLLEQTLPKLKEKYNVAVIEGDVETDRDAKRLENFNVPVALINTSGACHLESVSIEKALSSFDLDAVDLIFVENVGNLVCPAEFDIGEDAKVALLSLPEGDDKVSKYPLLFQEAALVLLTKMDLFSALTFDKVQFKSDLQAIHSKAPIIELSCQKQSGIDEWLDWITQVVNKKRVLFKRNSTLTFDQNRKYLVTRNVG